MINAHLRRPRTYTTVRDSTRAGKRFVAELPSGKKVHFGTERFQDFTQHGDRDRRESYRARHKANENWDDPTTAGFWSANLLWDVETLRGALSCYFFIGRKIMA